MYRVNLLPLELQQSLRRRNFLLIILLILCFAGLLVSFCLYDHKLRDLNNELAQKKVELAAVEKKASEVEDLQKQRQQVEENVKELNALFNGRKKITGIVRDINSLIPADTCLTSLSVMYDSNRENTAGENKFGGKISLEGKSDSILSVGVFVKKLSGIRYMSNVRLVKLHEIDDEKKVFFTITACAAEGGK